MYQKNMSVLWIIDERFAQFFFQESIQDALASSAGDLGHNTTLPFPCKIVSRRDTEDTCKIVDDSALQQGDGNSPITFGD